MMGAHFVLKEASRNSDVGQTSNDFGEEEHHGQRLALKGFVRSEVWANSFVGEIGEEINVTRIRC